MKRISRFTFYKEVIKSWLGLCDHIVVNVARDDEAQLWIAYNDKLGLAVEAKTIEALMEITEQLIPDLLEDYHVKMHGPVHFCRDDHAVA